MSGQQGAEQAGQAGQDPHLSLLLNAAGGQNVLMGYPGGAAPGLARYGVSDASLEEQILQRASALRTEALMQQQHQQRQHQLGAALAAIQQQQQLSSLAGLNPNLAALGAQEQEALLGRAAALRELGITGVPGTAALQGAGMERLQQLELGRLEELRRQAQIAALANLGGRQGGLPPGAEALAESTKSDPEIDRREAGLGVEKSKDDLRKTPGTVIVPCRARGMPMDHNFKTAYFVISEDAKHGEDLVCSYFACRNGGVKFRYCAHCMAPVAKRNFCRRHDHGMSAKAGGKVEKNDQDETSMDISEKSATKDIPDETKSSKEKSPTSPSEKKTSKGAKRDAPRSSLDVLSKAASSSFPMKAEPDDLESFTGKRKKSSEDSVEEEEVTADDLCDDASDAAELANISSKRRKMWNALLIKRPRTKDPRHLSSWLNEVLTVSDFETPMEQARPAIKESLGKPEKSRTPKHSEERSKEKKTGGKEKKIRKMEGKMTEDADDSKSKKDKDEMSLDNGEKSSDSSDKKSPKKNDSKEPDIKKESEDGFAGSFADWRDRKKEKALSKKGTSSLRK